MNIDAQEAALGLLSMGHQYHNNSSPSFAPATSSATLNSILTTTASPLASLSTIPAKRKQSALEFTTVAPFYQFVPDDQHQHHSPSAEPSSSLPPNGGSEPSDPNDTSTEAIDCICGFAVDDGFSIACDICSRWCHSACFGIAPGGVPEQFQCWTCKPRPPADRERAVRLQREKFGLDLGEGEREGKEAKHRRKGSPGLERKQRRTSTAAIDGNGVGKRRRRPSVVQPSAPHVGHTTNNAHNHTTPNEDEHVDIDNEPWTQSYVHIAQDIITNDDTRAKLRRQAQNWRGVTAVAPTQPPIAVKELSPLAIQNPFLSLNSNPHVLPPTYGLHTTMPISSNNLITPYKSSIAPSASYLSDPLNSYAHLGMPKPFVHLIGSPLDVALDSRIVGNYGRFVRNGCRPNAVLRPVLCDETTSDGTLGFGVFALRDLRANEEIVLGWEWDDGNAVHSLPALLEAPHMFPARTSYAHDSPHEVVHLRNQMSNILHALSSTFTTCACGARARDCALTQMAAFVDGHALFHADEPEDAREQVDMGPLVGRRRGFKTRERIPFSGGIGGMEMCPSEQHCEGGVEKHESGREENQAAGRAREWNGYVAHSHASGQTQGKTLSSPLPGFTLSHSAPSAVKRKGKERAVYGDGDVEMSDSVVGRAGDVRHSGKHQRSLPPSYTSSPEDPSPQSRTYHSYELSPPDPPYPPGLGYTPRQSYEDNHAFTSTHTPMAVDAESEERMPPKMRKRWMHREVEAMKESGRSPRSPDSPDASVGGGFSVRVGVGNGPEHGYGARMGLGIKFDLPGDEQKLMPPPPMPASMDPTTISSTDASISSPNPQHQHHPLPPPPSYPPHHIPISTSVSSCISTSMSTLPSSSLSSHNGQLAAFSSSPLNSFANLSLLSPAMTNQAYHQQQQMGISTAFPFPPSSPKEIEKEKEKPYRPQIWSPLKTKTSTSPPPSSSSHTAPPSVPLAPSTMDTSPQESSSSLRREEERTEEGPAGDSSTIMDISTSSCPEGWQSPSSSERAEFGHTPPRDLDSISSTPPPARQLQEDRQGLLSPLSPAYERESLSSLESEESCMKEPSSKQEGNDQEENFVHNPPPARSSRSLTPDHDVDHDKDRGWAEDATIRRSPSPSPASPPPPSSASPPPTTCTTMASLASEELPPPPSSASSDMAERTPEPQSNRAQEPQQDAAFAHPPPPPPQADSEPITIVVEPASEPAPAPVQERAPERAPSPPPPPKVKISLRDFAARRKKQKEEMELTKSIQASPMSVNAVLGEDDGPALAESTGGISSTGTGAEAERVDESSKDAAAAVGLEEGEKGLKENEGGGNGMDGIEGPVAVDKDARTSKDRPQEARQAINDEKDVEMAPPSVVSLVPLPAPSIPHINGYPRPLSHSPSPLSTSLASQPPLLLPNQVQASSSPIVSVPSFTTENTRETKKELVEHHIPPPSSSSPAPAPVAARPAFLPRRPSTVERSISPISPDPGLSSSFSARASQVEEDGEIGEASPPPSRFPLPSIPIPSKGRNDFSFTARPSPYAHSHSPPTQPRSFHGPAVSPNPTFARGPLSLPPSSSPSTLPTAPPLQSSNQSSSSSNNNNRPLPPSAPRALRQSLLSNRPPAGTPTGPPSSSSYSHGGSQYIPRGPSADRDRERDRLDWEHRHYRAPSRRGGGGHGWGR